MITICLTYPARPGARFDFDYYRTTHMRLVSEKWAGTGFLGSEALQGLSGGDGGAPPYFAVALLRFESAEAFHAAIESEAGQAILADVANYTDVEPVVQANTTLWNTFEG